MANVPNKPMCGLDKNVHTIDFTHFNELNMKMRRIFQFSQRHFMRYKIILYVQFKCTVF